MTKSESIAQCWAVYSSTLNDDTITPEILEHMRRAYYSGFAQLGHLVVRSVENPAIASYISGRTSEANREFSVLVEARTIPKHGFFFLRDTMNIGYICEDEAGTPILWLFNRDAQKWKPVKQVGNADVKNYRKYLVPYELVAFVLRHSGTPSPAKVNK